MLFLCDGNLFRSPYAAAALRGKFETTRTSSIYVASAGFMAPGQPTPNYAARLARSRGVDLSSHISRLVTRERIKAAHLIVLMSAARARGIRSSFAASTRLLVLGDLDPLPITSRTIADPSRRDQRFPEQVYSRIDRCVEVLGDLVTPSARV